jgi:hypothetical protein
VPLHRRAQADPAAARSWLAVAALALAAAALVGHAVGGAQRAEQRWGHRRTVLVTTRTVRAGTPLAGAVRPQAWPEGLVPPRALRAIPPGAWAAADLDPGVALSAAAVRGPGQGRGRRRTVALRAGDAPLPVREGDRVDVWATVDPSLAGDKPATRRIAVGAVVTAASDRTVVVAVEPGEVAQVARAATLATVTLVGSG